MTISTQDRFSDPRDFRNIIVKSTDDGRTVRIWDIARVELGARDYITNSCLNGKPAVALGIFQRPGTNTLETAEQVKATMTAWPRTSRRGSPTKSSITPPSSSTSRSMRSTSPCSRRSSWSFSWC